MNERLCELKKWLISCNYPLPIIEKAFFNAKLQGPGPKKDNVIIPFVSTYYSNVNSNIISNTANSLLSNVKDDKLKEVFQKCKVIHASRQLTIFTQQTKNPKSSIYKYGLYRNECKDSRCNL